MKVAFLGLGVMGFPMARHLAVAGHTVRVYNRTAERAELWLAQPELVGCSVSVAQSPALAAQSADIVLMCVGNDQDVREVALESSTGAVAAMQAGSLFIDHTTASKEVALELDQACSTRSIGFLDAPVSGGQAGAENGALTVMVGGRTSDFERAMPLFDCYAKKSALLGSVGAGQLTKMVNQICIAGVLQGLAEGVHFAQSAGLDVSQVVDVISQGAAQSWQMENRADTMSKDEFEFGFAVDWMRKDLQIALQTGRALEARLPLTALVDQFYADVQQQGGGRWDTSSLLRRLTPPLDT
ncbi:MAG: 3-hydroxyisobutyrate dehydrogenase-like beta-hydroxyacid dehydrogenase [Limisphaerales bacterium]|jgi:3-hydroxyisobutyrate dehydrogenase-like beta-hydroxyacid dehydrogenase